MEVTSPHCAGLDVHKKTVVACCLTIGSTGELRRELHTFGTMSADLLKLSDWLSSKGVTQVAMESTGEYWKPVYNLLEGSFEILVVNAQHVKNVPGRKTDVKDAEWIAQLLRHGLLRGSLIPPLPQRDLRDLTRSRTNLVRERVTVVTRLQKVLEWANIKLACVVSDINGVSARKILNAIARGTCDASSLANLAVGSLQHKHQELEQALSGRVREHHRFLIAAHLSHLDFLEAQIATFDARITQHLQSQPLPCAAQTTNSFSPDQPDSNSESSSTQTPLSWEAAVNLLDTIPGVARRTAELLLAEIGLDMSRFKRAAHLAKWARLCPGNNESGGKRLSGSIGQGHQWLRSGLVLAAQAAVRCHGTYLASVFRRLAPRRGKNTAIMAVAHRLLRAAYYILLKREPYKDLGANYLDKQGKEQLLTRLCRNIKQLGYQVSLQLCSESAP